MPPPNAERWFHTLVVVGASLGGCGGKTVAEHAPPTAPAMAGGSGSAGGGAGSATQDACAFAAQFVCDDYVTRTNCRCDLEAPLDDSACASPFDYSCVALPCQAPSNQICVGAT